MHGTALGQRLKTFHDGLTTFAEGERVPMPLTATEIRVHILAGLARDILVLTDGQTWAHTVEELKGKGARISAVLVGPGSLDANIGHLCAMTGGQLFYAPGANVAAALQSALLSLRSPSKPVEGYMTKGQPESLMVQRGGMTIRAAWQRANVKANGDKSQAVGRFAAALALPLLSQPGFEIAATVRHRPKVIMKTAPSLGLHQRHINLRMHVSHRICCRISPKIPRCKEGKRAKLKAYRVSH